MILHPTPMKLPTGADFIANCAFARLPGTYLPMPPNRRTLPILRGTALILLFLGLAACGNDLQEIRERGEIRIVTINAPTTYYEDRNGPTGFEFALAERFARHLGVQLKIDIAVNAGQVLGTLTRKNADIGAAGLDVTTERRREVRFGPPYMDVSPELVYRMGKGKSKPRRLQDLTEGRIIVAAGSSHAERLRELAHTVPGLKWEEREDLAVIDLLEMVQDGEIDYTVVSSNELAVNQSFFPNVRPAFSLAPAVDIAWAVRRGRDPSLLQEIEEFFIRLRESGELDSLIEQYFAQVGQLNYVGARTFIQHMKKRLPEYQELFERAAEQYGFDWRLLAAVGYQESHWDPKAVSPTGVRGLMMLTRITAAELGVSNRLDPRQSIFGGADYLSRVRERLPEEITEPDRTYMALASYNVGYGHLQDARKITAKQGGDPNLWADVMLRLPLLQKEKWYSQTRYGYARGYEPVHYVKNIRRYYDVLVWMHRRAGEPPADTPEDLPKRQPKSFDFGPSIL